MCRRRRKEIPAQEMSATCTQRRKEGRRYEGSVRRKEEASRSRSTPANRRRYSPPILQSSRCQPASISHRSAVLEGSSDSVARRVKVEFVLRSPIRLRPEKKRNQKRMIIPTTRRV